MSKIFYTEVQRFNQLWLKLLMGAAWIASMVPFFIGIHEQMIRGNPWGDRPMSDTGLIMTAVSVLILMGVITFLLFESRLIIEVDDRGIHYRFPPFLLKNRLIHKEEIASFEVRKYNPLLDYGGWGVRVGFPGKGKAYNVSGNIGLQLHLLNGKTVLFGTCRPDAIRYAMERLMQGSSSS
jgi:hypothetical protein